MAKVKQNNSMTERARARRSSIADIFDEFLKARKNQCAPATLNIYRDLGERIFVPALVRLTGDDLYSLTAHDLRSIIDDYQIDHNTGGVAFLYRHLKAFVNWFWTEYEIDKTNPMTKVTIKKPKVKPIPGIDRAGVNAMLQAAKEHSTFPERDIAMIMVLCDTGIRRASLVSLRMKDVDLKHGQLTVYEKDQDYHVKPFGAATEKALRNYLACLEDVKEDDPFWITLDGCKLSEYGAKEILRRLCNSAGIEPQSFHDFRRFFAMETYLATKDIYFVSRALDHKSVEVTKRYLNLDKLQDIEAIRSISPMDRNTGQTGIKVNRNRTVV